MEFLIGFALIVLSASAVAGVWLQFRAMKPSDDGIKEALKLAKDAMDRALSRDPDAVIKMQLLSQTKKKTNDGKTTPFVYGPTAGDVDDPDLMFGPYPPLEETDDVDDSSD